MNNEGCDYYLEVRAEISGLELAKEDNYDGLVTLRILSEPSGREFIF